MVANDVKVGIADLNIAIPPDRIMTIGLGSCIGIVLYDSMKKVGGLAHIMLPDSKQFTNVTNPLKFADLAVPILIDKMLKNGALQRNITAKIAGGASMFNFQDKSMIMDIGNRNSTAVREALKKMSIPIISEEVGGNKGRTIILNTESGKLQVRTVGMEVTEI